MIMLLTWGQARSRAFDGVDADRVLPCAKLEAWFT